MIFAEDIECHSWLMQDKTGAAISFIIKKGKDRYSVTVGESNLKLIDEWALCENEKAFETTYKGYANFKKTLSSLVEFEPPKSADQLSFEVKLLKEENKKLWDLLQAKK